jgi:hypothetical protein
VISTSILPEKALAILCAEAKETGVKVKVECFRGREGEERPVRFKLRERDYIVEEVQDRWKGLDGEFFKVLVDDGNLYILRRTTSGADEWSLQSIGPQEH